MFKKWNTSISFILVILFFIAAFPIEASSVTIPDDYQKPLFPDNVWTVNKDGSGDFTTIQAAIDASSDGDLIQIYPGVYQESLLMKRNITLQGMNKETTILKGTDTETGIYALSKQFEVRNLTIIDFEYGLDLYGCSYSKIEYNIIKNTKIGYKSDDKCYLINISFNNFSEFGWGGMRIFGKYYNVSNNYFSNSRIDLDYDAISIRGHFSNIFQNKIENLSKGTGFNVYGEGNIIQNTTIYNCYYHGFNGGASTSKKINLLQNITIEKCDYGIYNGPFKCNNITVSNCTSTGLYGTEIYITNSTISHNNKGFSVASSWIFNNTIMNNIDGLRIGSNTQAKGNIVKNNTDSGIRFNSNAVNSIVENNWVENNRYGIFLFETQNSMVLKNHVKNNYEGIMARGTAGNLISGNEIINNTIQAETDSFDKWYSDYPYGGNYWSDYVGTDIKWGAQQILDGSDGIGDVPYVINLVTQRDLYPLFRDTIPPVAHAGTDVVLDQGDIYLFNSSASTDDQLVHRVDWEFDYGGEHKVLTEKVFPFKFDLPGTFHINLTVYDFPGNSDTDDLNITVIDMSDPIPGTQGDIIIEQGQFAIFNGTSSWDNSAIVNYTWRFMYDGSPVQVFGNITGFRFITPGYYLVTLIVRDTVDRMAEITFNVTVIDTEKPIANAGEDFEVFNGDTVYFDPSLSTDNGIITNITWSFVYENEIQIRFGGHASFSFLKPGHYDITLNITDQFSNYDTDDLVLTVIDTIPPNAIINGTTFQEVGGSIRLDGLSSTDNGMIVRYHWEFTDTGPMTVEGPYLNHTFVKKGKHNVSLTVYDEWNLSDSLEIPINIIDEQKPIADPGNDATIPVGTTFMFNGSGSTDDGTIVEYVWSFQYDGAEKKIEGETTQFTFDKAGVYIVTLKVTDQSNNYGADDLELTVVDTGILKGTVVDKDGDPINGAKITIKWSNGRTYTGTSSANGSFSIVVPMGEVTYTISCSGYESVSGVVTIYPMKTTELDPSKTVLEKEPGSSILPFILIALVIILVLIILGVVVFVLTRKKKPEDKEEMPTDDLTLEQELSGSVIQKPILEVSSPIQGNVPVTSNKEPVVTENLPPKNDMDDLVSEMMKEMNEKITPDENATEEIFK